jgi:uncharacterized caspase-like protein
MVHSHVSVAAAALGHQRRYGTVVSRDLSAPSAPQPTPEPAGRNIVVSIGIDRYKHRPPLANAVRDAIAASRLFQRMGFEEVTAPLLDHRATAQAIQALVTDDLAALGSRDNLVLFYAGHGATRKHQLDDRVIRTGYLVPVDAQDKVATWVEMEGWLRAVSRLPPRHILVVLDSCHSGIALDPVMHWHDHRSSGGEPLATLTARRSRRVITSALADEIACDHGPMPGHSLFTGCLIEVLGRGCEPGHGGMVTGSELALHVQRRVTSYPHARQTPDFGTFALDDRGEMTFPVHITHLTRNDIGRAAPRRTALGWNAASGRTERAGVGERAGRG